VATVSGASSVETMHLAMGLEFEIELPLQPCIAACFFSDALAINTHANPPSQPRAPTRQLAD
jgi:hypothetical protein